MINQSYVSHSPLQKTYTKTTPLKLNQTLNIALSQLSTVGTNRSSAGSHYNSINAKQQDYSNLITKPVTSFDPSISNERSSQNSKIQRHNLIPSPSLNNSLNIQVYKQVNLGTPKNSRGTTNVSPLNKRPFKAVLPAIIIASPSVKQKVINLPNDNITSIPCPNHPLKRSKYRITNDQSISFCSRCAVVMVEQGFKVEEINLKSQKDNKKSTRRQEIDKFLDQVNQQIPVTQNIVSQLISRKHDVKKYYDLKCLKIQQFFKLIHQLLNQQRDQMESKLFQKFHQVNSIYETQLAEVDQALNQTTEMQKDIISNMEMIINNIESQKFKDVMYSYNENLNQFIKKLVMAQNMPVLQIKIPDLTLNLKRYSQIVQSISDEIEIGSINEMKESDKTLALSMNSSLLVSFDNKDQFKAQRMKDQVQLAFNNVRVAKVQLYDKPLKHSFDETNDLSYQEVNSQMIERDDIENSYNQMLNDKEVEDINQDKVTMFCSPRFQNLNQ